MKRIHLTFLFTLALALAQPAGASVRDGIEKWGQGDFAGAIGAWRPAADAGDPDAQFDLGQAYKLGRGVRLDLAQAEIWFRKAAMQGHGPAQSNLGLLLMKRGAAEEAMPWLERAATSGEARAQYMIGTAYYNGSAVQRDWPRAYAYMLRASKAGLPQAASALQQMESTLSPADKAKGLAMSRAAMDAPPPVTAPARLTAQPAPVPVVKPSTPAPTLVIGRTPAPPPAATAALPPPIKPPATGAWRVQLGAYSTVAEAQKAWTNASHKPALAALTPIYSSAKSLTRLRAGPIASKGAADRACAEAAAAGIGCFVVRAD